MSNISGVTFNSVADTIGRVSAKSEASLKATLESLGDNPSMADTLKMQQEMQQWSMFAQVQSTLVKVVSDALKDVVNKST